MSASTMTDEELSQLASVKGNLRRANGLVRHLNREVIKRDSWILEKLTDEDMWKYVEEFDVQLPCYCKSEIRLYTNARGFKHMSHFTKTGKYLGSVKIKGDKPIKYTSYEVPTKKTWEIVRGKFVKKLTN